MAKSWRDYERERMGNSSVSTTGGTTDWRAIEKSKGALGVTTMQPVQNGQATSVSTPTTTTKVKSASDFGTKVKNYLPDTQAYDYNATRQKERAKYEAPASNFDGSTYTGEDIKIPFITIGDNAKAIAKYVSNEEYRKEQQERFTNVSEQEMDDYLEYDKYLTDTEKNTIKYYASIGDFDSVKKYAKFLRDDINQRQGQARSEEILGIENDFVQGVNTTMDAVSGGVARSATGLKQVVSRALGDKDPIAKGIMEYAQQYERQEIDGVQGVLADVGTSVGQMLPSIGLNALTGGIGGTAVFGASVAGSAYNDTRREGYSDAQALEYATTTGLLEAGLQKALGGIGGLGSGTAWKTLGKTTAGQAVTKAIGTFATTPIGRGVGRYFLDVGSEGLEEYIQDVLDPIVRNVILKEEFETSPLSLEYYTDPDKLYSAVLGALTAGFMNAPDAVSRTVATNKRGKMFNETEGGADEVILSGIDSGEDTYSYKLAEMLFEKQANGEKISNYDLGTLYNANIEAVEAENRQAQVDDISLVLMESGMEGDNIGRVADIMQRAFSGDHLTNTEAETIINNESAKALFEEQTGIKIPNGSLSTKRKAVKSFSEQVLKGRVNPIEYSVPVQEATETATAQPISNEMPLSKVNTLPNMETATEGEIEANTGNATIPYNVLNYVKASQPVVDIESEYNKYGEKGQQAFTKNLQTNKDSNAFKDFETFYRAGAIGLPIEQVSGRNALSSDVAFAAYSAGQNDTAVSKTKYEGKKVVVNKNAGLDKATSTHLKYKENRTLDTLGKALGVRISFADDIKGSNAEYNMKTGEIVISKKAENPWDVVTSHEIVHRLRQTSAEEFYKLAEAVLQYHETNSQFDTEADIARYSRLYGLQEGSIEYYNMLEEIVADFISKEAKANDLAEMLSTKPNLLDRFIEILENIIEAFNNIIGKGNDVDDVPDDAIKHILSLLDVTVKASELRIANGIDTVDADATIEVGTEDSKRLSVKSLGEASGFTVSKETDGRIRFFDKNGKEIDKVTLQHMKESPIGVTMKFATDLMEEGKAKTAKKAENEAQLQFLADLNNLILKTGNFTMAYEFVGSTVFSSIKTNSDNQYTTSVDFPSVCRKTQTLISAMSKAMVDKKRGLTKQEIIDLYRATVANGQAVPCPQCYVFTRWIGAGNKLEQIYKYQNKYANYTKAELEAESLKADKAIAEVAEMKGIPFGNARAEMLKTLRQNLSNMYKEKSKATQEEIDALSEELFLIECSTWLRKVRLQDNYKPVPSDILFDLDRANEFADNYPEAWSFRNSGGASEGKSITPYADARFGEFIKSVASDDYGGSERRLANNPFTTANIVKDKKGNLTLNNQGQKDVIAAIAKARRQNLRGGYRWQSFSDFRYEYATDYIITAIEMNIIGAYCQTYTKVPEALDFFGAMGVSANCSYIPIGKGYGSNGKLLDSKVNGIAPKSAEYAINKYDTIGNITIGNNDRHITLMLKSARRHFIIPWHASGGVDIVIEEMNKATDGVADMNDMDDYTPYQSEKVLPEGAIGKDAYARAKKYRQLRLAILKGSKLTSEQMALIKADKSGVFQRMYDNFHTNKDSICYDVKMSSGQVGSVDSPTILPFEYFDTDTTYETAYKNRDNYIAYCELMGLKPKFNGMKIVKGKLVQGYNKKGEPMVDHTQNPNYWKLLIDRRMYGNDGKYVPQKVVSVAGVDIETDLNPKHQRNIHKKAMAIAPDKAKVDKIVEDAGLRKSIKDSEYLELAKDPVKNEKELRKMVDDMAYTKNYVWAAYHGTPNGGFNVFGGHPTRNGAKAAGVYWFTDDQNHAQVYKSYPMNYPEAENPMVYNVYLDLGSAWADIGNGRVEAIDYSTNGSGLPTKELKKVAKAIASATQYKHSGKSETGRTRKITQKLFEIGKEIYADFIWQITETVDFAEMCKEEGLGAVVAWEENKGYDGTSHRMVKTYGVFNPSQIKSADVVTYDDNDEVIPLSERFKKDNPDIRFSKKDSEYDAFLNDAKTGVVYNPYSKYYEIVVDGKPEADIDFDTKEEAEEFYSKYKHMLTADEDSDSYDYYVERLADEKNRYESSKAKKTSVNALLENIDKYRRNDLISLGEQLSNGSWDDIEELSTKDIRDGVEEMLLERKDDLNVLEAQSSKYGYWVRPAVEDNVRFSKKDEDYLALAQNPEANEAQLQKMVEEAAREAGYDSPLLYHGTNAFGFTKLDVSKSDDKISFFATDSEETGASYYSSKRRRISDAKNDVSEDFIEEIQDNIDELTSDLGEYCNRELGIRGWVDSSYFKTKLNECYRDLENGANSSDVTDDFYEFCGELFDSFTYEYHYARYETNPYLDEDEYVAWDDFFETDEMQTLSDEFYVYVEQIISKMKAIDYTANVGMYELYANTEGLLTIDCGGAIWKKINSEQLPDIGSEEHKKYTYRWNRDWWTTRSVAQYAKDKGYNGVIFNDVVDSGDGRFVKPATVYIFFNPQAQLKSADPVTYDDDGNIIPLSERFKDSNDDIRFSKQNTIYIKDGHTMDGETVDFINAILDGVKKGETRTHKSLTRKKPVGIAKDGKVYGMVKLGEPIVLHKGTQEYKDSLIEGTDYDIVEGQTRYYYPIEVIADYRDNPKPIIRDGNYGLFDDGEDDIRRSKTGSADILKQNAQLKAINEALRRELTITEFRGVDEKKVAKYASTLLKDYSSKYDKAELATQLKSVYDYMQGEEGEASFDVAMGRLEDIARNILGKSVEINDDNYNEYVDLRKDLRTTGVTLDNKYKADIPDFNDFRKRNWGKVKIINEGIPVDIKYMELSDLYPEFFPDDITHPAEQLIRMTEVAEDLKPFAYNPYDDGFEYTARVLASEMFDGFFDVPQQSKTFADKQQEKLFKERTKRTVLEEKNREAKEMIANLKYNLRWKDAETNYLLDSMKGKKDEQIAKLKKKYEDKAKQKEANLNRREKVERIKKMYNELARAYNKPTPEKHIPKDLEEMVAAFLGAFEFTTPRQSAETFQSFLDMQAYFQERATNGSEKDIDPLSPEGEMINLLDNLIRTMPKKPISNQGKDSIAGEDYMSNEEIETLYKITKLVKHIIRTYDQVLSGRIKERRTELAFSVIDYHDKGKSSKEVTIAKEKVKNFFNFDLANAYTFAEQMGGAYKKLFANLDAGYDKLINNIDTAKSYMDKARKDAGIDDKLLDTMSGENAKIYSFKVSSKQTLKLTKSQIMFLYLSSKREQAMNHILGGGITPRPIVTKEGRDANGKFKLKKKLMQTEPVKMTIDDVQAVIGTLTDKEKAFADSISKFLNTTTSDWGNEVTLAMYGYAKFTEKNYIGIMSDRNFLDENYGTTYEPSLTGKGWTKQVNEKATNPIVMDDLFSYFAGFTNEIAIYNALALPTADIKAVMNYKCNDPASPYHNKSVKQAVNNNLGDGAMRFFKQLMIDVNGGLQKDMASNPARKLLAMNKAAVIGLSLSSTLQQPTAILRATVYIDSKYITKGMSMKGDFDKVIKYSNIAKWKSFGYFGNDMGQSVTDLILGKKRKGEKYFKPMELADNFTWSKLWNACELEIQDTNPSLTKGSDDYYRAVASRFDFIVKNSQVVDTVLKRTQIMRSNSDFNRLYTSFMGEPLENVNMLMRAGNAYMKDKSPLNKRFLAKTVSAILLSQTAAAIAKAIAQTITGKKEDEEFLEKVWNNLSGDLTGMIPYVDSIASVLMTGEAPSNLVWQGLINLNKAIKSTKELFNPDSKNTALQNIKTAVSASGMAFGIPTNNIIGQVEGFAKFLGNSAFGAKGRYLAMKATTNINNSDNRTKFMDALFEAWQDGDTDAIAYIKADMMKNGITNDYIQTAFKTKQRKWLRDQKDIQKVAKLVKAYNSKDEAKRDLNERAKIIAQMNELASKYAEEGYSEEIVIAAIKEQAKK